MSCLLRKLALLIYELPAGTTIADRWLILREPDIVQRWPRHQCDAEPHTGIIESIRDDLSLGKYFDHFSEGNEVVHQDSGRSMYITICPAVWGQTPVIGMIRDNRMTASAERPVY